FMQHCALGRLPGSGSLSGEILSHDFVEAALMRRAGWAVWIAYDLPGSYEEMPPTLLDELKRDRRWCQGNLMNFRLFFTSGLHPAHRAVFMTGVMAYLSAPLWFIFLVLSTVLLAVNTLSTPQYFSEPYQLFPNWPQWHPEWAVTLFGATATLLFLPKLLSLLLLLAKGSRLYGGPLQLIASTLLETLFSALLAPIRMLFHTQFVTTALIGWAIQWKSPPREDAETPWLEAIKRHGTGTLLGVAWAGFVYWLNPAFLGWLLPVVGALIIAVPLSVWSSRVRLGRWFRARRFFLIPEESDPPRELRWTRAALRQHPDFAGGFRRAVTEPVTFALLRAFASPRERRPQNVVEARKLLAQFAFENGPAALSETQRNTFLTDPIALARLHGMILNSDQKNPGWDGK
ncbi:MAG: glucans biosynthesis glucosyltransferase MdoH, partial [Stenotrophobium sp.]